MDSLRYWVTEMHVDGFRFDLASALARSLHDVDKLSAFFDTIHQDPVVSQVKLIAEPWDVGAGGYQVGEFPPLWTEWNDKFRNTVREFWAHDSGGIRDLAYRLTGSSDLYGDDGRLPYASINFVTAHDGFTARDLVSYESKHNEANGEDNRDGTNDNRSYNCGVEGETDDPEIVQLRLRQVRNLMTTLLLSTGVPMVVAGDERWRTQRGNNNAYVQDNEISWIDWSDSPEAADITELVRTLIDLRRRSPVLRQRAFFDGRPVPGGDGGKDLAWFGPQGTELTSADWFDTGARTIGMYLDGRGLRHRGPRNEQIIDDSYLLILHAGDDAAKFQLPGTPWADGYDVVIDTVCPAGRPRTTERGISGVVDLTAGAPCSCAPCTCPDREVRAVSCELARETSTTSFLNLHPIRSVEWMTLAPTPSQQASPIVGSRRTGCWSAPTGTAASSSASGWRWPTAARRSGASTRAPACRPTSCSAACG